MKEATGELNMTVITVVAITAVAAFFYAFVWPAIKTSIASNTCNNTCTTGQGTYNKTTEKCTCSNGQEIDMSEEE